MSGLLENTKAATKQKLSKSLKHKNIAISPLDWGLGHTARIVPVVKYLQKKQYNIYIFCNKTQQKFLQNELENVNYIYLKGYNVDYSKSDSQLVKIFFQIPKILRKISYEHNLLKKYDKKLDFDKVVSDNRYGFFLKNKTSAIISHQIYIKTPLRFLVLEQLLNKINTFLLNRFSVCLIPDFENEYKSLAGELSHKNIHLKRKKYIGILSRFPSKCNNEIEKKYVLAILSGPETQRNIFEKIIIDKFKNTDKRLIIAGSLGKNKVETDNITIKQLVNSKELFSLICNSEYVITRSGYSSIMDLYVLQKKAVLVATPGQTEQEYLAEFHKKNQLFKCYTQQEFSLR